MTSTHQQDTEEWYRRYYRERGGADHNSLLTNPGVLGQHISAEWAILRALQDTQADPARARVLDVGAGAGGSLLPYLLTGFAAQNLAAVDIQPERVAEGRLRFPSVDFRCADARALPFGHGEFDIVSEASMFVQITDESMAASVAAEMCRVTRPAGFIILADWRYDAGRMTMRKLDVRRIARLFAVGRDTEVVATHDGCLIPPVGRFLSAHAPSLYFPVAAIFRPLVGLRVTVLRKY